MLEAAKELRIHDAHGATGKSHRIITLQRVSKLQQSSQWAPALTNVFTTHSSSVVEGTSSGTLYISMLM